ncbi:MAG: 2-C-methyl-D-erythritol 4-phosphate cytidylyltransferase [Bacteroidales bacterium]|nr:2-C-methyl-D-erythritol 4-phosphate cytidylyltransferase [Bacteroidales bacterium]
MERKRYVVIMAAGSGSRMGAQLPKQFLELDGKAILQKTMEAFLEACPGISVICVLPDEFIQYWKDYCLEHNFICPQILVKGGITRFHSVRNALERVPEGALVAVHDGVRPLVTPGKIRELFGLAENCPGVIPVVPCVDTMKVLQASGHDGLWEEIPGRTVDRSILFGAQTPQIFQSEIIKAAYGMAYDTSFTDDASVVSRYGKSLSYAMGERLNIKITTPEDLILARAVTAALGEGYSL